MVSNISVDNDIDYAKGAKTIAINIFDEYIRNDANNLVLLDKKIRCSIFLKFGCELENIQEDGTDPNHYNTEMINEDILNQNLNQFLFFDLFNFTLDSLKEAYEDF